MDTIQIDDVAISITRKPIRTLRLRVCPPHAEVHLSVPLHASRGEVLRFVTGRTAWIRHHRERMLSKYVDALPPCHAESGDLLHLWGVVRRLEVRTTARTGLDCTVGSDQGAALVLSVLPASTREQRLRVLRAECRRALHDAAVPFMVAWAAVLGVGVPELRIRSMKTRWGTCNPRARRIWLSAELVRHDPAALEYVIVHELAHLIERSHGPRFVRILDTTLPDWRARKLALNAAALHQADWV